MPFRPKNAGATFQRAMEIDFANEKYVFLVVYLDDLTVFSGSDDEHFHHLRVVFQCGRKFGISLNPKRAFLPWMRENCSGISPLKMAST